MRVRPTDARSGPLEPTAPDRTGPTEPTAPTGPPGLAGLAGPTGPPELPQARPNRTVRTGHSWTSGPPDQAQLWFWPGMFGLKFGLMSWSFCSA